MTRQDEILKLVETWRSSGKSRIAFAREAGIPISTLQRWIRRAEQQTPQQTETIPTDALITSPPPFVEIADEDSIAPVHSAGTLESHPPEDHAPRLRLELGDGVILTLY